MSSSHSISACAQVPSFQDPVCEVCEQCVNSRTSRSSTAHAKRRHTRQNPEPILLFLTHQRPSRVTLFHRHIHSSSISTMSLVPTYSLVLTLSLVHTHTHTHLTSVDSTLRVSRTHHPVCNVVFRKSRLTHTVINEGQHGLL